MSEQAAVMEQKRALREYAEARRRAASRLAGPGAGIRAANHFLAAVPVPYGATVSGYFPIKEELDVMPLLGRLSRTGYRCCLPVIDRKNTPLLFRTWQPGASLLAGPFRIPEPLDDAPPADPTHLLVPLLAFDAAGYRLGYGGGYYDRSLRALREARPVIAVGMAFSEQQVEQVPHSDSDERLDWIVTERGAIPVDGERALRRV